MEQAQLTQILKRIKTSFNSTERTNFETLWDQVASYCRPVDDNIKSVRTPGAQKNSLRLVDVGIRALNTFASGMSSSLTPKGTKFLQYGSTNKDKDDSTTRWLNDVSQEVVEITTNSNLFVELSKAFSDLGLTGTTFTLSEPDFKRGVRYKTFYINQFTFLENADGEVDTVFIKLEMTRRQISQKFDLNNIEADLRDKINDETRHDDKMTIYQAIQPRRDYDNKSINPVNHQYASLWILEESSVLLEEGGYRIFPGSICRWNQATDELYGRSPAMECLASLNMINTMEASKLKSAQRLASPQWMAPNDGSTRNLNNNAGGVIYYNAANPNAKPEQLATRDLPQVTQEIIKEKEAEVNASFFVNVFNPMTDASTNPTATEINKRAAIANADLVPKINRVIDEYLRPLFLRTFYLLWEQGKLTDVPPNLTLEDVSIEFESRAAKILKLIEAGETTDFIATLAQVAQINPEVMDAIDLDAYAKLLAEASAIPTSIFRSDYEINGIRQQRQAAQEAQAKQEAAFEEAKILGASQQDSILGQATEKLMGS